MHDLMEVRRADLFFAFGDEDEVDGELAACAANGMERREERSFGTFLVYGAAADDYFAETGLVDERGVPRRRGPFGRTHLVCVAHELTAQGFGFARIDPNAQ